MCGKDTAIEVTETCDDAASCLLLKLPCCTVNPPFSDPNMVIRPLNPKKTH